MEKLRQIILIIIGVVILIVDTAYFFGLINLPNPSFVPKAMEIGIAFMVGLTLILFSVDRIKGLIDKLMNKL